MKWSQEIDLREETGQDRRQKTRKETGREAGESFGRQETRL
jgi:hypothetical protein